MTVGSNVVNRQTGHIDKCQDRQLRDSIDTQKYAVHDVTANDSSSWCGANTIASVPLTKTIYLYHRASFEGFKMELAIPFRSGKMIRKCAFE